MGLVTLLDILLDNLLDIIFVDDLKINIYLYTSILSQHVKCIFYCAWGCSLWPEKLN